MITTLALFLTILTPSAPATEVKRTASVYSDKYVGRRTASGEIFSQDKMTAASNDFPLGSKVELSYNGRKITVKINDRMAKKFTGKRIDLSRRAFRALQNKPDGLHKGVIVKRL